MLKIGFEAPDTIRELIDLLNRSGHWELTLVDTTGRILGFYQAELLRSRTTSHTGQALIYNGQVDDPNAGPVFVSDTDEGAACFLHGFYLGLFGGKSLEAIQDDLSRHRNERLV